MPRNEKLHVVPEYDGNYLFSDEGRLYSLSRSKKSNPKAKRELRPVVSSAGRRYYKLTSDGVSTNFEAAELAAMCHRLARPGPNFVVFQRNGNRDDYSRENLVWVTADERKRLEGKKQTRYRGVQKKPGASRYAWQAKLVAGREVLFCRLYLTELDAARAYNAAVKRFGLEYPLNDVEAGPIQELASPPKSLVGEAWRPLPAFEDTHEVSDCGRIRSTSRMDAEGHRTGGTVRHLSKSPAGRLWCVINDVRIDVAYAVYAAFSPGPMPAAATEITFRDGNASNPVFPNLVRRTKPTVLASVYSLMVASGSTTKHVFGRK